MRIQVASPSRPLNLKLLNSKLLNSKLLLLCVLRCVLLEGL